MLKPSRQRSGAPGPTEDLLLPEAYNLLAALMQFVVMVLLSVAIYMRNWVWLEPDEAHLGPHPLVFYTFGLPYKMNISRNSSEYLYFFQKDQQPLSLRPLVITVCFLNLCFGVTAFFLAYLEFQMLEKYRITLVASFHIFSGLSTMVLIAICVWCFEKVSRWLVETKRKVSPMVIHFGESFFIGLLAFGCAIWAMIFTLCAIRLSSKPKTPSKAPDAKQ